MNVGQFGEVDRLSPVTPPAGDLRAAAFAEISGGFQWAPLWLSSLLPQAANGINSATSSRPFVVRPYRNCLGETVRERRATPLSMNSFSTEDNTCWLTSPTEVRISLKLRSSRDSEIEDPNLPFTRNDREHGLDRAEIQCGELAIVGHGDVLVRNLCVWHGSDRRESILAGKQVIDEFPGMISNPKPGTHL